MGQTTQCKRNMNNTNIQGEDGVCDESSPLPLEKKTIVPSQ